MSHTTNHTPLPWDYTYKAKRFIIVTRDYSEKLATIAGNPGEANTINKKAEATAAFIVKACNYHYPLLTAVEKKLADLKEEAESIKEIEDLVKRIRGF